ncbi:carboxypeptidase S [Gymnopus androsaceus JB14]|uniref:Carboxypeptidase S n=1 Tax=Gymnopus androsaceus JB14 TaxID=1447944 RepID=A0A6A4GUG3_9AGAR|nr:carboxypeptidase S [Gymnopus androsaceus JB14]
MISNNGPSRAPEKKSIRPSTFSGPDPRPSPHQSILTRFLRFRTCALVLAALILVPVVLFTNSITYSIESHLKVSAISNPTALALDLNVCPQASVLIPHTHSDLWTSIGKEISSSEGFKATAIDWLSGAVQVETEMYDDMGPVDEDPRWENRLLFHDYLEKTFPLVHTVLKLEKVNKYGLLYTWDGSDASLKPGLLMAHFDIVPVNPDTISEWAYPPYSGHFDGKLIWGRGSSDDKGALIGTMQILLQQGFKPTRTFVAAFGFDEEAGGHHGARELAATILDRYGEKSFAFIIDEGGVFSEQYGTVFATPGVAEKGSMNVEISVAAPGGHSSIPPDHTSIGILSALVVHLENHPFEAHIDRSTPAYQLFQCFAEYGTTLPPALRDAIQRSVHSDESLRGAENILLQNKAFKSLVGTTQAVDMIHGGVKSNALPEQAWAIVNHRIASTSSRNATMKQDADLLLPLAQEFGLTFSAFGELLSTPEPDQVAGSLKLTSFIGLEPAPVTPTRGDISAPYQLVSGTIKATYNAHRDLQGDNILVGPGIPRGNGDTRYYWPLSDHIFRYKHQNTRTGHHTVNESLSADSLLELIRFYVTLILNADESNDI